MTDNSFTNSPKPPQYVAIRSGRAPGTKVNGEGYWLFSPGIYGNESRDRLFQAHHLIVNNLYGGNRFKDFFAAISDASLPNPWKQDDYTINGVFLPQKGDDALALGVAVHNGSHPAAA